MDVSIIIVNYNTKELTNQCINSIYEKTLGVIYEIILVDNASSDGSKEFFENDNRIKYLYSKENLGFGRANNLALKTAKGRNILFLNPDTILINNAVLYLSNFLDNNDKIGACGGNLYTRDFQPNYSYEMFYPSIIKEINRLIFNLISRVFYRNNGVFNNTNKPIKVKSICGADLMVKKNILDIVGGYNDIFFMYAEETELCHRISRQGYMLMSIPNAKIIHLDGGSFMKSDDELKEYNRLKMRYQSKIRYYDIVYGKKYKFVAFFIWRLTITSRLFIYKSIKSNKIKCWEQEYQIFKEIQRI